MNNSLRTNAKDCQCARRQFFTHTKQARTKKRYNSRKSWHCWNTCRDISLMLLAVPI